jgi:hypothetical protein
MGVERVADAPLLPHQYHLVVWVVPSEERRPVHDGIRGVVSAHRIQRKPHVSLDCDDLSTAVKSTRGASSVRKHGFFAFRAKNDLNGFAKLVIGGAPSVPPHLGGALLGYSHGDLVS